MGLAGEAWLGDDTSRRGWGRRGGRQGDLRVPTWAKAARGREGALVSRPAGFPPPPLRGSPERRGVPVGGEGTPRGRIPPPSRQPLQPPPPLERVSTVLLRINTVNKLPPRVCGLGGGDWVERRNVFSGHWPSPPPRHASFVFKRVLELIIRLGVGGSGWFCGRLPRGMEPPSSSGNCEGTWSATCHVLLALSLAHCLPTSWLPPRFPLLFKVEFLPRIRTHTFLCHRLGEVGD